MARWGTGRRLGYGRPAARGRLPTAALVVLLCGGGGGARACSTFLVGRAASADGSVFVTHSDDGEARNDPRLVVTPARPPAGTGTMRDVWPDHEDYPRFVGFGRGAAYEPQHAPGEPLTRPVGRIPEDAAGTFKYFDSNYGVLNEKQLGIGESTCSAVFAAKGIEQGGEALFCVNELSRIAMERCATARCAVELMGALAEAHGFYGASQGFEGSGETLLVADPTEGWVFHVLPDPTGRSAIWVAHRVPDDHVTVVMNMFTIRDVNLTDTDNFVGTQKMYDVAQDLGCWAPGPKPLSFVECFSDGEYAHKYYSGRRMWGAFRLIAPSLELNATYGDLRYERPYPWSVKPDAPVSARDLMRFHREWYAGTPYDLSAGVAAGPFGSPDRVTGGKGESQVRGAWERPIALFRTTYTFIVQLRNGQSDSTGGVVWFGPHAAHGTVFTPFAIGMEDLPWSYQSGNWSTLDKGSAWWATRYMFNIAHLRFNMAIEDVRATQQKLEAVGVEVQKEADASGSDLRKVTGLYTQHAAAVVNGTWALADRLMLRFADGFVDGDAAGYPAWWLKAVGYEQGPTPVP